MNDEHELKTVLEKGCLLSSNFESFILTLPNTQLMSPRVKGQKDKTGQITSGSIESMWPFLSPEESKKIDEELLKLENID